MTDTIRSPAPRPCDSCPYRRDVPSGIWAAEEYAKLPLYDRETYAQPPGVFLCHQRTGRVCAGWAGCHDGNHLLALRLAESAGRMAPDEADATIGYVSPVPLWDSGEEAARHGMAAIERPGPDARDAIDKLVRAREPHRRRVHR